MHATDYSNVCVTGLYDPYTLQWLDLVLTMLSIPRSLLPQVKDSAGDWGSIDANIFGAEIPIGCVVKKSTNLKISKKKKNSKFFRFLIKVHRCSVPSASRKVT